MVGRRQVLFSLAAAEPVSRTRVILLGTKGGPTPSRVRAQPATAIVIDGSCYLVDCGNGVAQQMAKAGIPLTCLDQVFITHNHSDHVADVGALAVLAWGSGLSHRIGYHGPPPLAEIVRQQVAALNYDVAVRTKEEGRPPLAPLIRVEERSAPGLVYADGRVRVTSALVDHYGARPAFAYRFDTPGRSVVISGDTTYSPALVALARGADLLIHEAIYAPAIGSIGSENATSLRDHLVRSHATTEQVGRVAAEAGVKKLVLSHLVPADPAITDEMWLAGVRKSYRGVALVGRDLMVV